MSEYDPLSAAGVERLKQVASNDLGYGRTWVLLNKMLPEFVDKFSEFLSVAKYLPPIPWNAEVVRAYARRKTALDLEGGNEYTLAIKRTVESLFSDDISTDLDSWSKERTFALRAPLEEQYVLAESELSRAFEAKRKLDRKIRLRNFSIIYALAAVGLSILSWALRYRELGTILDWFSIVDPIVTVSLFVVIGAGLYGLIATFGERRYSTQSARYDRTIERLEENLKQLEALRAANYEEMVQGLKQRREP